MWYGYIFAALLYIPAPGRGLLTWEWPEIWSFFFPHNDRYSSIKLTTAGLNGLLLAAECPQVNFPLRTIIKFKSFFTEFPEAMIANFVFLLERSIIRVWRQILKTFYPKISFRKKSNFFVYPKSVENFKIKKKLTGFFKSLHQKFKIIMNKLKTFPIHEML